MKSSPLDLEKHRLPQYRAFAEKYGIGEEQFEALVGLYEIEDLNRFLPDAPSEKEKQILRELIGVEGVKGYMDWIKSNHTFELIMQWQEQTGNFGHAMSFSQDA